MDRNRWTDVSFVAVEVAIVIASPILVATVVEGHQRSRVGPQDDLGDPDGDSIIEVVAFLGGAAAFLVACLMVLVFEIWRRRQRARTST